MPDDSPARTRPVAFAVFLVIAGALGLLAAFELSIEKILTLSNPDYVPNCNVGVLVSAWEMVRQALSELSPSFASSPFSAST